MINLTRTSILPLLLAGTASLSAQTAPPAAKPPVRRPAATTTAHSTAPAAVKPEACATDIPTLSPKIPALPAGLSCPKPLYIITTEQPARLSYVSPMVSPTLKETLGLEPSKIELDYVDTKIGTGPLAQPKKWYSIHYTGYLTDGTKFDSSLDRGEPISIPYGGHSVIPGWDTGFDGMHVGGKRRLFIPFQLAYGANGRPPQIPAKAELIFDVELVAQSDTQPAPKTPPAAAKPADTNPSATTPGAATPQPAAKPATPPPTQSVTPDSTAKPQTPKQ